MLIGISAEVIQDIYNTSSPEHQNVINNDKTSNKTSHYNSSDNVDKAIKEFKSYFWGYQHY